MILIFKPNSFKLWFLYRSDNCGFLKKQRRKMPEQWPNLMNLSGGLNLSRGLNMVGTT